MEFGKDQGGWPAMRQRHNGHLVHAEFVEEAGVRVRLVVPGRPIPEDRTEIPEPRWDDTAEAGAGHRLCQNLTLVESSPAAVDYQDGGAGTCIDVFDVTVRRGEES